MVIVHREIVNGRDAFGKAAKNEHCALAVNRAKEARWVEYDGRTFEVPGEGAVWLSAAPAKPARNSKKKGEA